MSQSGHRSEGEKQNQGASTQVEVTMAEELSPALEPKTLPQAGESEKKNADVVVRMFPGSETSSIEGCEQGPCPCTGPNCNDGGGGGSRGYGIEEEL
ncbi:hypothetical protein Ndes2526B_g04490 [Nannochloris sp. 'desiccata']|nr:hypothetical protein NADE_003188 [Chlorella desiccata (nom. nud.)]